MGVIGWIVMGALAGWLATKIAGVSTDQGCIANIVTGIVGAFVGGVLYKVLAGEKWDWAFNPSSFAVAVGGAVVLLVLLRLLMGRPSDA